MGTLTASGPCTTQVGVAVGRGVLVGVMVGVSDGGAMVSVGVGGSVVGVGLGAGTIGTSPMQPAAVMLVASAMMSTILCRVIGFSNGGGRRILPRISGSGCELYLLL